jgi:hypothetical protein
VHRLKISAITAVTVLMAIFVGAHQVPAHAATTRVWTGAVNLNWGTAGNWSPAGVPVDGDSLLISPPSNANELNNNIPDLTLASLAVGDSALIHGNELAISNSIQVGAANIDVILDLPITLAANVEVTVATSSDLVIRQGPAPLGTPGIYLGGHTLTKFGGGALRFVGDLSGLGTVAVQTGGLVFAYPVSFTGTVSLASDTAAVFADLQVAGSHCGSATNAAFVLSDGNLSVTCPSAAIRSISGIGQLEMLGQDSRLEIAGDDPSPVFSGTITGAAPSQITCCSYGSQAFAGTSTYSGLVFINSGQLAFAGATFPASAQFTVQGSDNNRPLLGGHGTFGDTIITTGYLRLSAVLGQQGFARFPTLQLAPDVLVDYQIDGPTAGVDFTQVVMTGQIVLDGAYLRLDFGAFLPAVGQKFTLVKGATALLDTFHDFRGGAELKEGDTFTIPPPVIGAGNPDLEFSITYKGGAGHDVVVTRLAGPVVTPPMYKRFLPMVAHDN